MTKCPACYREMPEGSRFCASCGKSLESTADDPTYITLPPPQLGLTTNIGVSPPSASNTEGSSNTALIGEERFIPGTLIAERYRIVSLLGTGGMSEVYRANDLKLGQPVALKFLPESISRDANALARFHKEVRIARLISHPNICRVYDIGEVKDHHFISMEYVDGEDLGSLLRRIGKLPQGKALDIARDLCAGLTAAHDKGVLHRDLKPSNVMIDGRGQVLIMDFGIAALAEHVAQEEVRSGTPAYMAPEQLSGKEVTIKSDIYALGLVLYEIFTGKRAVESATIIELARLEQAESSGASANLLKDIDPAIERIIMRCLEKEPSNRPATVKDVAAALPGGGSLSAALQGGQTLSPEMVAAGNDYAGMRPLAAVVCLLAILVGLILAPYLSRRTDMIEILPMEYSPEVLITKSREMLRGLGYTDRPVDKANGFYYDIDYLRYAEKAPEYRDHLTEGRPAPIVFWYREDSRYLESTSILDPWKVTPNDPPPTLSGMLYVETDVLGRLVAFTAIPHQIDEDNAAETAKTPTYDWTKLFSAAGLDITQFAPTQPSLTPMSICDARAAWTGNFPNQTDIPLRIEAAGYRGKPVYFRVVGPWYRPKRMEAFELHTGQKIVDAVLVTVFVLVLIGAVLLARNNLRRDRGDRRGAFRLGAFIFTASFLSWIIGANHVPTFMEFRWILLAIGDALLDGAIVWTLYVALEPYVRRGWPTVIISWSRLLAGRLRDPLVGRDVMIGIAFGIGVYLLSSVSSLILFRNGAPPATITLLDTLMGMGRIVGLFWGNVVLNSVQSSLIALFLFYILRVGLRLRSAAGIGFVVIIVGLSILSSGFGVQTFAAMFMGISAVFVLLRFGLVSFIFLVFTFLLLGSSTALTTDFSAWYVNSEIFSLAILLVLSGFGFHSALAGQSIFKGRLLPE